MAPSSNGLGHCSFTAEMVSSILPGVTKIKHMSKNSFDIEISDKALKETLVRTLASGYPQDKAEDMVEVLMVNCSEEGLNVLVRASLGLLPEQQITIGSEVWVKSYKLGIWNSDTVACREKGYLRNDYYLCHVISFNPYLILPYKVKVNLIDTDGNDTNHEVEVKCADLIEFEEQLAGDTPIE